MQNCIRMDLLLGWSSASSSSTLRSSSLWAVRGFVILGLLVILCRFFSEDLVDSADDAAFEHDLDTTRMLR